MSTAPEGAGAARPSPSENVAAQRVGESTIILDLRSGEYFSLDGVGAEVWDHCRGDRSVQEIVDEIASHWDVAHDVLRRDVSELLDSLHSNGLIDFV